MKDKKTILLAAAILFASAFAFAKNEKKTIICTIYPQYDWVMNIIGDKADRFDISYLTQKGMDLHNYQPNFQDIAKLSECDLFVFVGGESDKWVQKAVSQAKNKNLKAFNMMEILGDKVREEEIVEGMEHEHDHDHEDEEEAEYDEHVWLSLKNAKIIVEKLSVQIAELDGANSKFYKSNADSYIAKLDMLDKEFEQTVSSAKNRTILFGDRFPFRYLADDYGLKYFAAFVGCSADTEASFETIAFLAKKVDELNLSAILTIEKSDKKIAETIKKNSKSKNQKILEMNSIQSVSSKEIKNGTSYIELMKQNLAVLKTALN
ncbi:MAG: metal ABC transporter solute-binding protein, Zn/Mn family [Treponema sp.]